MTPKRNLKQFHIKASNQRSFPVSLFLHCCIIILGHKQIEENEKDINRDTSFVFVSWNVSNKYLLLQTKMKKKGIKSGIFEVMITF